MAYMDNKDLANTQISERREKEIGEAVSKVMEAVDAAAKGRPVRVIAATKTRDVGEVMAAIRGGIKVIGENRVQELEEKMPIISSECQKAGISISAHLIGQLQKNKIAKVLPLVDCIESVESFDKAQEISERVPGGKLLDIYLEVNESGEESKSGCKHEEAFDYARSISSLPGLRLVGLMTVADPTEGRACFERLRNLRDKICAEVETCQRLSMGMSGDFAEAIACGATDVRIGTAIFGERSFK